MILLYQFSCSVPSNSLQPHGCSMPGFPVHHQFLELAQTHVYLVGDAIQLSHPLLSLLLLSSVFPSIRVFSNESVLFIRWPKYWSFSFNISPSMNIQKWFPLGLTGLISLQSKGLSRVFSYTTVQKHHFFGTQLSLWSNSHIHTFSSVQLLSRVQLLMTPWTAARQASLSFTVSQSLFKLMSIDSVMPSNHLILCHLLRLLPSIFPRITIFSNESALCIRGPKYGSFSFSTSPSNEYSGLISFRIDRFNLLAVQGTLKSLL